MATTLILSRHGLTTRSRPEQHLGQRIDIALSVEGEAQAAALATRLAPIAFDRVISSPLLRARQTADAVRAAPHAARRPPLEIDPRLTEMNYGAWEGLTYEEIDATDGPRRRRWESNPAANACPDGESGNDVARRARSFLTDLLARSSTTEADDLVLAVAHSTLNRVLVCVALSIPIREFRARIVQSQVNLTALQWASGAGPESAELMLLNDVSHVRGPGDAPWE
jgi:broad specificity phosphatase PhoE